MRKHMEFLVVYKQKAVIISSEYKDVRNIYVAT